MEIDSSFTGTLLKPFTRTVEWRSTMNYAAALNDDNDFYFDDERFKKTVAHPVYCAAVTWPVVERIWDYIEAENFPMEILATQVHYSEHIQYYRLVSPGDRLLINGKIAAILPHRAGTRVVIRFDATDERGQPVFTEHIGSIMRGVQCVGDGRGEEKLPRPTSGQSRTNKSIWESRIFIDRCRPFIYDGCSDIVFPIHTSRKFARQVGLPDIILQGTATLGYAIRELINRETDGNPSHIFSLYARFSGMVIPGSDIRIILNDKERLPDQKNLYFSVMNQKGDFVIKEGYAAFAAASGNA